MKHLIGALLFILAASVYAQTPPIQIHSLPNAAPITGNGTEWLPMDQGLCPSCTFRVSPQQLATFVLSQPFTINASNITQGTLPCAQLPSFSGAFTTNGCVASVSGIAANTLYGNPTNLFASPTAIVLGTGLSFSGNVLNATPSTVITSADGSLTVTGSPGASIGLEVNASNISTGSVPPTALPALSGNGVQLVQAIGNVANMCGLPFIDSANATDGNYILLAHQTIPSQNGPWQVHAGSCPGPANWTRPIWFQSGNNVQAINNMSILVNEGTNYGGTTWTLQFAPNPVIIDTTAESWFVASPKSIAAIGGTLGITAATRASYVANVLDFGTWSGTIRKDYGNSNATSAIACTQGSNSVTLSGVTIPNSSPDYTGASILLPGCANPGAINSANPGDPAQFFTFVGQGTGYIPQQTLACQDGDGVSVIPCWIIVYSTVVDTLPTITSGGTGCTNGTQTFTATTGIAGTTGVNYPTFTGTVSGNALTSLASFVANGPYTQNPVNLAAEPVTGGGCATPPTLNLSASMGANTGGVYVSGNYTTMPSNPVGFAPLALPNNSMTWASTGGGTATVIIKTFQVGTASTLPGWMQPGWATNTYQFPVTISGATPSGYNGTYTATLVNPTSFTFPLASNPGASPASVAGTYTISPAATGATANLFWYGNPLVGTISNIVNAGGNSTFNVSNPANLTLTDGGGKVTLWKGTDDAEFSIATGLGVTSIKLPNPPVIPGWESGYMTANGITLNGIHRWDFDCQGHFISGAVNATSPVNNSIITIGAASNFRDQGGSTLHGCHLDADGGFNRDMTVFDWDWLIYDMRFENAAVTNIGWSLSGHSRENHLFDFYIINDGYSPLTPPVEGIDSEAFDTRISDGHILQRFQQTSIFSSASTGDVNYTNVHAEGVLGGPTFQESGDGNRWLGGNEADSPAFGFPGFGITGSYDTFIGNDVIMSGAWAGQLGILTTGAHHIFLGNTPNRGGIPTGYTCISNTSSASSTWVGNVACNTIFPSGIFNINAVSGAGTATKYVCTDSSGNLLAQTGPC